LSAINKTADLILDVLAVFYYNQALFIANIDGQLVDIDCQLFGRSELENVRKWSFKFSGVSNRLVTLRSVENWLKDSENMNFMYREVWIMRKNFYSEGNIVETAARFWDIIT